MPRSISSLFYAEVHMRPCRRGRVFSCPRVLLREAYTSVTGSCSSYLVGTSPVLVLAMHTASPVLNAHSTLL